MEKKFFEFIAGMSPLHFEGDVNGLSVDVSLVDYAFVAEKYGHKSMYELVREANSYGEEVILEEQIPPEFQRMQLLLTIAAAQKLWNSCLTRK